MEEIWDESMREGLGGLILRVAIAEGWEEKYLGIRGTEKGQGWAESESDEGRGTKEGVHCKKELAIFPSPAGMSLTKLSLGRKKLNYSRPGRVWSVTSRLGTGKRLTLFYSVSYICYFLLFWHICSNNAPYPPPHPQTHRVTSQSKHLAVSQPYFRPPQPPPPYMRTQHIFHCTCIDGAHHCSKEPIRKLINLCLLPSKIYISSNNQRYSFVKVSRFHCRGKVSIQLSACPMWLI